DEGVVSQIDKNAAGIARSGHFAHLAPLVEQVLQQLVGLQLGGVRVVHGPPEQLVALATGDKARFGEAGGLRRHGAKASAVVGQRARSSPPRFPSWRGMERARARKTPLDPSIRDPAPAGPPPLG